MAELAFLFIFAGIFCWLRDLILRKQKKYYEHLYNRCSPPKSSLSSERFRFQKASFLKEINALKKSLPYEDAVGSINPYTDKKVKTEEDYDFYILCRVLKNESENHTRSLESNLLQAQEQYVVGLNAYKIQLGVIQKQFRRRGIYNVICMIVLCILFVVFLITPSRSKYMSLQKSLENANAEIVRLTDLVDASYKEGYSVGVSCGYDGGLSQGYKEGSADRNIQEYNKGKADGYSSGYMDGLSQARYRTSYNSSDADNSSHSSSYIGNRSSKIFHRSSCSFLPEKSNRVSFSSRSSAIISGYSACGKCNP